ncbi:MAG: hypothetical protein LKJ50_04685 [Clostridiales bacterium]|jgi:HK97 gp10 family phage protein|nr:hypothetical protein [Clostridiales bacterium]MCI1961236.1 hypothetical protein [Clostridiales bacterium]MCI2021677.1 hypothetical protein [Clostridiales bacterium]MCI2026463.1 hypothetical protein [Clostridiales bacterium]
MKIQLKGMDEYILKLTALESKSDEIAKKALYEGAKVIADAVKENIKTLPTEKAKWLDNNKGEKYNVCTPQQKDAISNGLGITHMESDADGFNLKVGFDTGYVMYSGNKYKFTKKYPNGMPIPMLVRSIEHGSSVRQKHPFVRPAITSHRKEAKLKMQETASEEIQKIMKG